MNKQKKVFGCFILLASLAAPLGAAAVDCSTWQEVRKNLEAGMDVRLAADVRQDSQVILDGGVDCTLDMNGKQVTVEEGTTDRAFLLRQAHLRICGTGTFDGTGRTYADRGSFAYVGDRVSDSSLTIDGDVTLTNMCAKAGGAIFVHGGTLTMNGGRLTGCSATEKGGAIVSEGKLEVKGGVVDSCSAGGAGGGLYVANGTAVFWGGSLESCTARGNGGAVGVCSSATLEVYGGRFVGNRSDGCGGGIYTERAVKISGGFFHGNTSAQGLDFLDASGSDDYGWLWGGLWSENPLFGQDGQMESRCVLMENARVTKVSDGLYVVGTDVVLAQGRLQGGSFSFDPSDAQYAEAGLSLAPNCTVRKVSGTWQVEYAGVRTWNDLKEALTNGFSVAMSSDITTDGTICDLGPTFARKSSELDLKGHTLTLTGTSTAFILRTDAADSVLRITDSSSGGTGRIVGTTEGKGLGMVLCVESGTKAIVEDLVVESVTNTSVGGFADVSGTLEMSRVVIRNCSALNGGAVYLDNEATGSFTDCTFESCFAQDYGGGILHVSHGTLALTNTVISGCTARAGGGLAVRAGLVTMDGGAISNNLAQYTTAAGNGGGVLLNGGDFTLNAGVVADNRSDERSDDGGIVAWANATFTMNGGVLKGNTSENSFSTLRVRYPSSASAYLNAGLVDDGTVVNAENYVTLPEGYALAPYGKGSRFLVGKDVTVTSSSDRQLTGGLLRFNPCESAYVDEGLSVAAGYIVVPGDGGTYAIAAGSLSVNGTLLRDQQSDDDPKWYLSTSDRVLHLASEGGTYEISGLAGDVAIVAEERNQTVVFSNLTNACTRLPAFCVKWGHETTVLLKGRNRLVSQEKTCAALGIPQNARLTIDCHPEDPRASLEAIGGAQSAGIGCGSNTNVVMGGSLKIQGGFIRAVGAAAAAGIGGSAAVPFEGIEITGGTVEATGGAVGLGAGDGGTMPNGVRIVGGSVFAVGGVCPEVTDGTRTLHCVTVPATAPWDRALDLTLSDVDYSLTKAFPVEAKYYLWMPDGNHHFVLDGLRYEVCVDGADADAEPSLAGVVRNGSFEYGANLPGIAGACAVRANQLKNWTVSDGITLFGGDSDWARTNGFDVPHGGYALALAPGAWVEQAFGTDVSGVRAFSVNFQGPTTGILEVLLNDEVVETLAPSVAESSKGRFLVTFTGCGDRLAIRNASVGTATLAIDWVGACSQADGDRIEPAMRTRNGGFETGMNLPDVRSSAKVGDDVMLEGWSVSGDATLYGAECAGYPAGVAEGDYALALSEGACVSQRIIVPNGTVEQGGASGMLYEVSFFCATKEPGTEARVKVQRSIDALDWSLTLTEASSTTNGGWTLVSQIVFMPVGTNIVRLVNGGRPVVLVDDFACLPHIRAAGELLLNGSFEYGFALPPEDRFGYSAPNGPVEPSIWTLSGSLGVFGARSVEKTHAGTRDGIYGLFLENGARAEQTFAVNNGEAGEYRLSFAVAAYQSAEKSLQPSVRVSVDGELVLSEKYAPSGSSYDTCVVYLDLSEGVHTLAFEAKAANGHQNNLVLDAVGFRKVDPDEERVDVTGEEPRISLTPSVSKAELVRKGIEPISMEGNDDLLEPELFLSKDNVDLFRLEPFAGAYPHPAYQMEENFLCEGGFALAVAGLRGTVEGPIVSFEMKRISNGESLLFAFENTNGGKGFAFRTYQRDGETGWLSEMKTFVEVNLQMNAPADEMTTYVVSCKDGKIALYANGQVAMSASFTLNDAVEMTGLRLGAFPEGYENDDLRFRRCAQFALSGVRAYSSGLTDTQIWALSEFLRGTTVDVTAYDPATQTAYLTSPIRVGTPYGAVAAIRPSRPGYEFGGWTTIDSAGSNAWVTSKTLVRTLTDHRIFANWSNIVYHVTYDFQGYPFAQNETRDIKAGDGFVLPQNFLVDGVPFNDWTNAQGVVVSAGMTFPVDGRYADETLYADYEPTFGPVTFAPMNGQPDTEIPDVRVGDRLAPYLPADPQRLGYEFDGWWSSAAGGMVMDEETCFSRYQGEVWYAHWNGLSQEVTWSAPGGMPERQTTWSATGDGFVLPPALPVSTNDERDVKFYGWGFYTNAVPESGDEGLVEIAHYDYSLADWVVNANVKTPPNVQEVVALWWTACALDANGGVVSDAKTYLRVGQAYGAWMALPRPTYDGFAFGGWHPSSVENVPVSDDTLLTDAPSARLVASWSPQSVTVTLDANGGVNSEDSVLLTYLSPYGEIPGATRPGYALEAWHYLYESGKRISAETVVSNYNDHTLVASWSNAWYRIGYKVQGRVVQGQSFGQRYENPWPALYQPTDSELQEVYGLDDSSKFCGWLLEDQSVREGERALVTNDTYLVADIVGVDCTIQFNVNGGILDVDKRTLTLAYGAVLPELPVPVRKDWRFDGWYRADDGAQVVSGQTWRSVGTVQLVAHWTGTVPLTLRYRANLSLHGAGDQECTGVYYNAPMPSPRNIPSRADDARFLGWWQGDVQCYGDDNRPLEGFEYCPFTADTVFVAHWASSRDGFATPASLADGVSQEVIGLDATDEAGEPSHDGLGDFTCTHWYSFAVTNGAHVTVTFQDLVARDEPWVALALYRGTKLEELECVAQMLDGVPEGVTLVVDGLAGGTYRLAIAQSPDGSALNGYALVAEGIGESAPASVWTDPRTVKAESAGARIQEALVQDGFSSAVASRLATTNKYIAFRTWTDDPEKHNGRVLVPDDLNQELFALTAAAYEFTDGQADVRIPSVLTASAYELTAFPTNVVVEMLSCDPVAGATDGSVRLSFRIASDFARECAAKNADLLEAAVTVEGASSLVGPWATSNLTYTVESVDCASGTVSITAQPKVESPEEAPSSFFYRGIAY